MIYGYDLENLLTLCSEERTYANYQLLPVKLPGFEKALDDMDSEQLSGYYKKASYTSLSLRILTTITAASAGCHICPKR
jgi:hypothetical protein